MIKLDGYYVSKAKLASDSRSKDVWYSRVALAFHSGSLLQTAHKFFKEKYDDGFSKADFKSVNDAEYFINNNIIRQVNYWEDGRKMDEILMEVLSPKRLKNLETGSELKFVPWEL